MSNKVKTKKVETKQTEVKTTDSNNSNQSVGLSTNAVRGIQSIKAVLLAFLIGIILVLLTGQGTQLFEFLTGFISKNFSDITKFTDYLSRLSYLVPLGLAVAVAFRMGIFNIGASGQALGGGAIAFFFATKLHIGSLGWILCLAIGIGFGMLIATIIAFLKNRFKISEVISSIMINWMIFYFVLQMNVEGVSETLENNTLNMEWFSNLFSNLNSNPFINASTSTNIGILFIVPIVIVLWYAYKHTKWGYKQELIGNNPKTGDYLGINSKREIYKTMMISGALAGLAGSIYYIGYATNLPDPTTYHEIPAWTFDGITIALLGFSSPIGVLGSSMVYALFTNDVDTIVGNIKIVSVMVGVMILFIASSNYKIQYGKRKGGAK